MISRCFFIAKKWRNIPFNQCLLISLKIQILLTFCLKSDIMAARLSISDMERGM